MSNYNKMPMSGKMPEDPNLTIEVNNTELEQLVDLYSKDKTIENLNKLLSCIVKCRVLVPAELTESKKPAPCMIKNKEDEIYLPIYTSKAQIPQKPKSPLIMNVPYAGINLTAAQSPEVQGIVINPFSSNLIFKKELLLKIKEVVEAMAKAPKDAEGKAPQMKTMKLTQQQYLQFEKRQFEGIFLPKKMYAEPETFFQELCDKKEEYLDQLFEESYKEKRMYPYLPEDFSVMAMNITEDLLVVRVDMPLKDMSPFACVRIYLTWNSAKKEAHYYTIETGKVQKEYLLGEINSQMTHINHEAAPVEGAELQKIVDMASQTPELTS